MMGPNGGNSNNPILYILVALVTLVALNLAVSSALLVRSFGTSQISVEARATLPAYLTTEEIEHLKIRIIDYYNERNIEEFYSEFDDVVRIQLSEEDFRLTLDNLYSMAGRIEDAAYAGFEDLSSKGQPGIYSLSFQISVSDSDFTGGSMAINVYDRGDRYGLMGFFLNPSFRAGQQ